MGTDALLPLRDVTSHLRVLGEHYVGLREIPVDRIVGSVDRSVDFDRFFRTRKRHLRRRLDALREAFGDRPVPPITVYEAGGVYFVSDGHHRVALARQDGGAYIDAEVTEIQTSHQLHPGVDVLELVHTAQHRRLNERTRLDEVAPGALIEFSRPAYYGELLRLIQAHAYDLSEARGEFVSLPEATRDWYSESWLPALAAIDATGLRRAYDFKTYGDPTSGHRRSCASSGRRIRVRRGPMRPPCSPATPSTGPIAARRWPPVASRCRPTATRPETTAAGSPLGFAASSGASTRVADDLRWRIARLGVHILARSRDDTSLTPSADPHPRRSEEPLSGVRG